MRGTVRCSSVSGTETHRYVLTSTEDSDGTANGTNITTYGDVDLETLPKPSDGSIVVTIIQGDYEREDTDPQAALEEQRASLLAEYQDRVALARRLRLAIANEDDPVQQRYYQDLLETQEDILQDLRQQAAELGITQEQLNSPDQQAVADANDDPIQQQQGDGEIANEIDVIVNAIIGFQVGLDHGALINFNNFTLGLTPWADDIRELVDDNGYAVADGFSKGGVLALAAAGGLAAWPAIAEFARSSFVLPAFGDGGLALAGGGSTSGAVVIGG
ncbi:MAG: hypothetical protein ABJZ55_02935 [Fuerstiella sp.]